MSQHPPIQIVDENDQPLRGGSMDEAHQQGLIHRIVYIFVEDEAGRVLLQKRSPHVVVFQNVWDVSAAGHVDAGEDYLTAAKRELQEELGISGFELQEIDYYYNQKTIDGRQLNRFCKVYKVQVPSDTQFKPAPHEVSEIRWLTVPGIIRLLTEHPEDAADGLVEYFERYYPL
jgi:isopentenyldiphosphate isomerase